MGEKLIRVRKRERERERESKGEVEALPHWEIFPRGGALEWRGEGGNLS